MKYTYLFFIIIIVVIILFNSFTKKYNANLFSGFTNYHTTKWSPDLIRRFNVYQLTVNDNVNQFNLDDERVRNLCVFIFVILVAFKFNTKSK